MSIDIESLVDALVGSDVPGSTVTLRVKKAGSGDLKDVEVVRVESRELADKRRLFELFTDIENYIGDLPVWFAYSLTYSGWPAACLPHACRMPAACLPHACRASERAAYDVLCWLRLLWGLHWAVACTRKMSRESQ